MKNVACAMQAGESKQGPAGGRVSVFAGKDVVQSLGTVRASKRGRATGPPSAELACVVSGCHGEVGEAASVSQGLEAGELVSSESQTMPACPTWPPSPSWPPGPLKSPP